MVRILSGPIFKRSDCPSDLSPTMRPQDFRIPAHQIRLIERPLSSRHCTLIKVSATRIINRHMISGHAQTTMAVRALQLEQIRNMLKWKQYCRDEE